LNPVKAPENVKPAISKRSVVFTRVPVDDKAAVNDRAAVLVTDPEVGSVAEITFEITREIVPLEGSEAVNDFKACLTNDPTNDSLAVKPVLIVLLVIKPAVGSVAVRGLEVKRLYDPTNA